MRGAGPAASCATCQGAVITSTYCSCSSTTLSQIYIYVREGALAASLVKDASERFNISLLAESISAVPLRNTDLILPERHPRMTLLGQAWGAARLGHEALSKLVPELFVDTTGWAFTFPLARLAGCRVACYVHYPTIRCVLEIVSPSLHPLPPLS